MSQIRASTIAELAPRIRAGDISPVNLVRTCLAKIEAGRDGNAFIAVCGDDAIARGGAGRVGNQARPTKARCTAFRLR